MWDDTVLLGIATQDPDAEADERHVPGASLRHRDEAGRHTALKRWVDSRLEVMRKRDTFNTILGNSVSTRVPDVPEEHPPRTIGSATQDATAQCPLARSIARRAAADPAAPRTA